MKFCLYTNFISPHQMPLVKSVVARLGEGSVRYFHTDRLPESTKTQGWVEESHDWIKQGRYGDSTIDAELENCDILLSGVRDLNLFQRRAKAGKKTFYMSERWFKPIRGLPGNVRMFFPHYRRMAHGFVTWLNSDPLSRYLAIGPWAKKDMLSLGVDSKKIVPWGYFVEPSSCPQSNNRAAEQANCTRLLWVGRFLKLKRVQDIIRAVDTCCRAGQNITLDVYGLGPEEVNLKKLVSRFGREKEIRIFPPVSIEKVRELMREHDVYVLSSNGYEGWGAVVSEALEEGMKVVGTYEAGASATLLPQSNLYHAGDWRQLARILGGDVADVGIGEWTAARAAERLLSL